MGFDGFCSARVAFFDQGEQLSICFSFELLTEFFVGRHVGKGNAPQQRIDVESRPAANDRHFSLTLNFSYSVGCVYDEIVDGEGFFWRDDIEQMVWDATHFGFCYFSGTDVETSIHLPRIGTNNFTVELPRKHNPQRALARRCGSDDNEYSLLHVCRERDLNPHELTLERS